LCFYFLRDVLRRCFTGCRLVFVTLKTATVRLPKNFCHQGSKAPRNTKVFSVSFRMFRGQFIHVLSITLVSVRPWQKILFSWRSNNAANHFISVN
ncbi:MAG TPA: hypothetical protein VK469_09215, partial [Candidatus Kapabacteria bacterium]|nr:hypothetical protein [Candidatus Kapabacteria bacterium]